MSEEGFSAAEERRTSSRFKRDRDWEKATVRCANGVSLPGDVHDESLDGVSLFLNDVCNLALDQEVEIAFSGEKLQSRVCYIQPQQEGGFVVGFASVKA